MYNESVTITLDRYHAMLKDIESAKLMEEQAMELVKEAREKATKEINAFKEQVISVTVNYLDDIEVDLNKDFIEKMAHDVAMEKNLLSNRILNPKFSITAWGDVLANHIVEEPKQVDTDAVDEEPLF